MVLALSALDVGIISGMIAAAVALTQIFVSFALPLILLGVLKEDNTGATTASAVSWSVIGRFLHASRWPTLLAADSASTRGVPKTIVFITRLKIVFASLIAIAAVVTPLGLYQTIVEDSESTNDKLHYIKDRSNFGLGTSPRVNLPFYYNLQGSFPRIPQHVIDVFQSGLENMQESVSSVFDIEARTYKWQLAHGFRMISSNVLEDDYLAIEGLVVDMKNGGIGFRNHSAPPRTQYGSAWWEDLLFIEPESQCVDTNLTVDFSLPKNASEEKPLSDFARLVLTDRGGFAKLDLSYPINRHTAGAASLGSSLKTTQSTQAFTYLDSHVGKQFPLMSKDGFISILPKLLDHQALYENPFEVGTSDFYEARVLCEGTSGQGAANPDNFVATCGLVYGVPKRRNNSSSSIDLEPGSIWSVPVYSCIMTAKATIKEVKFRFNGTDDLSSIKVTEIKNKVYKDKKSKPLWGVERSDNQFLLDISPLWGLISGPDQGNVSVYTIRKESLYLPGYTGVSALFRESTQNLPGADFYRQGMKFVFNIDSNPDIPDYTGRINLAMYRRWKKLSRAPATTPKILNLIWTDFAANAFVGTRGLHGARTQSSTTLDKGKAAESKSTSKTHAVKFMRRRALYHWPYAIPALIVLSLTLLVAIAMLVFTLMGRTSMTRMRQYHNKTSQGRIFTTHLYHQEDETAAETRIAPHKPTRSSTRRWVENKGKNPVTVAEGENDSLVIDGPQAAQARPLLQENPMAQREPDVFNGHQRDD